ncbi:hypothetical protein Cni_G14985 [Canna indica]|uniref:BPS1-like protein n=1 Tax=Canna indica TaxID=4628 RepID=A0AAQ3QEH1_9LILI|nr:hypothetical protein Cni_G14985 [Canna indica]
MSQPQDGQRTFFPLGNPFRMMLPKGSYKSLRIRELLLSFEQNLAENYKKLKPKDVSDVLTLSWLRLAIEVLADVHNRIKTLVNELQLPVSDWDEKWIDMYLDSSVKLLDICISLTSELSRLDQGQLLLQYVLHLMDTSSSYPSLEKLARAHSYLHEWIGHVNSKSPKLEKCPTIIESLQQTLTFPKVKGSKGKVLMRALYGVKVMTVFVCGIFSSILSSRSKALPDLHISGECIWVDAFKDFQVLVNEEVKRQFVNGKMTTTFKEIEAVKICASSLHDLISSASCKGKPVQDMNGINLEEKSTAPAMMTDSGTEQLKDSISNLTNSASCNEEPVQHTSGINYDEEAIASASSPVSTEKLKACVTILADRVEGLGHELDYLRKQADDFFQIILAGRDALLSNLRVGDPTQESIFS